MSRHVTMVSTNNPRFKYLEDMTLQAAEFKIGTIIWFGSFHTSSLKKVTYKYKKKYILLTATTLNSVYVFKITEGEQDD